MKRRSPAQQAKAPVRTSKRLFSDNLNVKIEVVNGSCQSGPVIKDFTLNPCITREIPQTPLDKSSKLTHGVKELSKTLSPRSEGNGNLLFATPKTTKQFTTQYVDRNEYHDLKVSPNEFRPSATLTTGQCFHWKDVSERSQILTTQSAWGVHNAKDWVGILRVSETESLVISIHEKVDTTMYRVLHGSTALPHEKILRDYLQLDYSMVPLYATWSSQDPKRLSRIAKCIPGVRLVKQDPWECLVSFICSSNNNIPRITKILTSLRENYGKPLMDFTDIEGTTTTLFSFPSLEELHSKATEQDLRSLIGMGYRAKYIMSTMHILKSLGGEQYLHDMRRLTDPFEVQERLLQFPGVGRKVADCIALFSLCQTDAVPVDTHVWNVCRRYYDPKGLFRTVKSITPTIYRQVGDVFRSQFQPHAGWAHSLLFVAELPSFQPVLDDELRIDIDKVTILFYYHLIP
jgi:N-glycosylase/DNA lyase